MIPRKKSETGFLVPQNKFKKNDITLNSKRQMLHMRLFFIDKEHIQPTIPKGDVIPIFGEKTV